MNRTTRSRAAGEDADNTDDGLGPSLVAAGDASAGTIGYDDLGQPRWTWVTEVAHDSGRLTDEDTFDYLKALSNDALEIADETDASSAQPSDGYDPYDTARIKTKGWFPPSE